MRQRWQQESQPANLPDTGACQTERVDAAQAMQVSQPLVSHLHSTLPCAVSNKMWGAGGIYRQPTRQSVAREEAASVKQAQAAHGITTQTCTQRHRPQAAEAPSQTQHSTQGYR
jgi:hypothetical protein